MASAAEQLAANLNFGAFSKAPELRKRIWFTLAALIVYRIGTYIPLPGIDPAVLADIFNQSRGGILDMFNMFSGGALHRMTIFALNIMPYVSASIVVQLMTAVVPSMETLKKEGEAGRKKLNQYTRYLTVLLALVQGYGLATGIESMTGAAGTSAVLISGHVLPHRNRADPGRRHRVPDVAGRTDHQPRHRQRHLADHLRRHRRGIAACAGPGARTRPYRRAVGLCHPADVRDGDRRHHVHRVHGTRPAPHHGPVSEAPGRQPHVRRRKTAICR